MTKENYWLKNSKILKWGKFPQTELVIKNDNYFDFFPDGEISVYENCITQHIKNGFKNKTAIITVDSKKKFKNYTYSKIDNLVNNFILFIKSKNNKPFRNTRIMIHSSASINSATSMLACTKVGIFFSVIFEDLEYDAILKRSKLFKPDIIFTSKSNIKKFKKLKNRNIKIYYFEDINSKFNYKKKSKYLINKNFKSTQNFFTLFTSGSTGIPKGVIHTIGGYTFYAKYSSKKQFGISSDSIILTASDAGWINGHTYALFGPLLNGATTILIEKPMMLIDHNLLEKILSLGVTVLYLPVTLIRIMRSLFPKKNFFTNDLLAIGSMGEPLAYSVGKWFSDTFSFKKKAVVNTYFQTETGGIIMSPKFNDDLKNAPHGSVGNVISKEIKISKLYSNLKKEVIIKTPWPGCMKKIINGKKEWKKYWSKDGFRMFDLATRKKNTFYIHGRVDDVINIRGHRIGSEEIESTLLKINGIRECCAISLQDDLAGNKIYIFLCSMKKNFNEQIEDILIKNFGTFAIPENIFYLSDLPKTRSGKILRRLLRNILMDPKSNNYGDVSTLMQKDLINEIKNNILKS